MAAPSWVSKGADFSNTSATPSFAVPAGTAANLVVIVSFFANVNTTTVTVVPSGFTVVPGSPVIGGSNVLFKYWKRLTGADVGTYDFTLSSSQFVEGAAELYDNVYMSGSPFDAGPGSAFDDVNGLSTPAISTTTLGSDRANIHTATAWSGGVWTPNAGYTKRLQPPVGLVTASDKIQAVAGPTGSVVATVTVSDKRIAHLIALIGTTVDGPVSSGGGFAVANLNSKINLLNAATGTGAGSMAVLDKVYSTFSVFKRITGIFSALVVSIEGSLDGTNWFQIGTDSTVNAGVTSIVDKPVLYIRANCTTFTGGTNVSVDVIVL